MLMPRATSSPRPSPPRWRRGGRLVAERGTVYAPVGCLVVGRVVLVEPGLAQRFFAQAQVAAQVDRFGAGDRQVEHGAPVALDAVRHRLGAFVGEFPARGPQHRLGNRALGQVFERAALELDDELALVLRIFPPGLAAAAQARGDAARQPARVGAVVLPVQAVVQVVFAAGSVVAVGDPDGVDVVMDLVVGRDLDQLHHAGAPVVQRLHPGRGAAVVAHAVEVVVELPVALHQPEAARVFVLEAGDRHPLGVVQRPPDPLPRAGPDVEAVGIVHLGPPVGHGLLARLGEPVHRGQRRQAQAGHGLAQMQVRLDVHHHARVPVQQELVGARDRRPVEQGIDRHRLGRARRRLEPEGAEVRELLRPRAAGVEGDAAGGQADLAFLADPAEVGGAQEGRPRLDLS